MKLRDLYEKLSRVHKRDDVTNKMTAEEVVMAILGDRVTTDVESLGPGTILLTHTWSGYPMFSTMDEAPGQGGAIGLMNLKGSSPKDVAIAAHEAHHALMQLKSKNSHNEHVVNRLTGRWLQDNFTGMFLHQALEQVVKSKLSYKRKSYPSTKAFLKDYYKSPAEKNYNW